MNTGPGQGAHGPSSLPNWWPTDPRHTSPSTSDVMSQLCRVCGEPAAGFHFGAFTCEGCKSFFGRTYNNLSSISECKNNGECVINKKNRTSCKACRLRKCLVVGMSKSGSRYGRRSNWFKIHCLLQEQQQHHQNQMPHHHQHHQHVLQPPGGGGGGLHFAAQRASRPSSLEPGRTPPSPQQPPLTLSQQQQPPAPLPMPWADVKHHLRLDADNNNSVVGDLNKDAGGRLSISAAAAAAAAVAQAVGRPELLRWPSPFFPAFPFPPPSPFFLALQQQQQQQQQQHHQHHQHHQPTPPPTRARRSTSASGSSSDDDDDDDGPPSPKRSSYAVIRDAVMPPVQDAPMDLSVSAVAAAPPPDRPSRSPSPSDTDGGGRADGCARSPGDVSSSPTARTAAADETGRRRKRRRRRRRRKRREDTAGDGGGDGTSATADSGSDSDVSTADDGGGGGGGGSARPMKNVPLDLTCSRS